MQCANHHKPTTQLFSFFKCPHTIPQSISPLIFQCPTTHNKPTTQKSSQNLVPTYNNKLKAQILSKLSGNTQTLNNPNLLNLECPHTNPQQPKSFQFRECPHTNPQQPKSCHFRVSTTQTHNNPKSCQFRVSTHKLITS